MNNLSSYCGLVDAKIRASDKDLLVRSAIQSAGKVYTKNLTFATVNYINFTVFILML